MHDELRIGEVAKRVGVSIDTIRYYERRRLLPVAPRTPSGYRLFSVDTVERVHFIKQAQDFGFSLDEIKSLLSSGGADECLKMRDMLRQKVSEIDGQIEKMKGFRKALSSRLTACDDELKQNGRNAVCPAFIGVERGKK